MMRITADIPNWCEKNLPVTGSSVVTVLAVVGVLTIVAGWCLMKGSRRPVVAGLVIAVTIGAVGAIGAAPPAEATSQIACPPGYHPFPDPAKMSLDFVGLGRQVADSNSENKSQFTLNVDLNGGTVRQPFTVKVTGSAIPVSPFVADSEPTVVTGTGWSIASPTDGDSKSYVLTYSPAEPTMSVPPAVVDFYIENGALKRGGNWTLSAAADAIPANTASVTAGYPFSFYYPNLSCGANFSARYGARVVEGLVVVSGATLVAGTPPFKYVATDLVGYTMAEDGTITYVDADPGSEPGAYLETEFSLTVTDAAGETLTVPGFIAYQKDFQYLPETTQRADESVPELSC